VNPNPSENSPHINQAELFDAANSVITGAPKPQLAAANEAKASASAHMERNLNSRTTDGLPPFQRLQV